MMLKRFRHETLANWFPMFRLRFFEIIRSLAAVLLLLSISWGAYADTTLGASGMYNDAILGARPLGFFLNTHEHDGKQGVVTKISATVYHNLHGLPGEDTPEPDKVTISGQTVEFPEQCNPCVVDGLSIPIEINGGVGGIQGEYDNSVRLHYPRNFGVSIQINIVEPNCRADQIVVDNECQCPADEEEFNGQCVAQCPATYVRDTTTGSCVCPEGMEESNGQCVVIQPPPEDPPADEPPPGGGDGGGSTGGGGDECPEGQVKDENGICYTPDPGPDCRADQVEVNGACECPEGDVEIDGQCQTPPELVCDTSLQDCAPMLETGCPAAQYNGRALLSARGVSAFGGKRFNSQCLSTGYKDAAILIGLSYDSRFLDITRADGQLGQGWTMGHQQRLSVAAKYSENTVDWADNGGEAVPDVLYYQTSTGEEFVFNRNEDSTFEGLYHPKGWQGGLWQWHPATGPGQHHQATSHHRALYRPVCRWHRRVLCPIRGG